MAVPAIIRNDAEVFDGPRRLKRRGFTLADTQHLNHILYFGRRDLEKGRAPAARPLFAIVVDLRFDCLADVYLEDIALLRRVTFLLRKAKARSVAAGDRDLPHCHRNPSVDDSAAGLMTGNVWWAIKPRRICRLSGAEMMHSTGRNSWGMVGGAVIAVNIARLPEFLIAHPTADTVELAEWAYPGRPINNWMRDNIRRHCYSWSLRPVGKRMTGKDGGIFTGIASTTWVCRNPWRLIAFKTKAPTICGRG